jgi:uncharacterized membrane protein
MTTRDMADMAMSNGIFMILLLTNLILKTINQLIIERIKVGMKLNKSDNRNTSISNSGEISPNFMQQ